MVTKRKRDKKGRFVREKSTTRQITGHPKLTLSPGRDKKRTAKKPGRRVSKNGKLYYERRKNRSDKNKKKKY